jgi:hypothetical protein
MQAELSRKRLQFATLLINQVPRLLGGVKFRRGRQIQPISVLVINPGDMRNLGRLGIVFALVKLRHLPVIANLFHKKSRKISSINTCKYVILLSQCGALSVHNVHHCTQD